MKENILLVGCGKMGSALLGGWLKQGTLPSQITVIEPHAPTLESLQKEFGGIKIISSISELTGTPNVVVLAVKPQTLKDALADYKKFASSEVLFISIAAGKTLSFFEEHLGEDARVVRAMPNLPAVVSKGVTVLCKNTCVDKHQWKITTMLFAAVGRSYWIEDESQMDAVTALSGSGPAYIFLLAEAMTSAGIALGLPSELAKSLAIGTLSGSAEFLSSSPIPAATLREQVTSPAGTTAAALALLMDEKTGLPSLMEKAMRAAYLRSQELAE